MNDKVVWLSIFEYSKQSGKSISTIRRHIKSGKVISRFEEGKYFVKVQNERVDSVKAQENLKVNKLNDQIDFLKKQLILAKEEINELKMLVDLYENNDMPNDSTHSLDMYELDNSPVELELERPIQ